MRTAFARTMRHVCTIKKRTTVVDENGQPVTSAFVAVSTDLPCQYNPRVSTTDFSAPAVVSNAQMRVPEFIIRVPYASSPTELLAEDAATTLVVVDIKRKTDSAVEEAGPLRILRSESIQARDHHVKLFLERAE